jgi:hypothetical protein
MGMTQIVGIVSPSYTGSTVLSQILGQHDDILSVGESHWLVDQAPPWRRRCSICQDMECPVFTSAILSSVDERGINLLDWLQSTLGQPKVLLSSDKNIKVYDRIGPPAKAIVLFRTPALWVTSWVVRAGRASEEYGDSTLPRLPDGKVEAACNQYVMQYRRIWDWLKAKRIPYMTVWWDGLIEEPRSVLNWIYKALGVPENPEAMDLPSHRPVHSLGGNADVVFKRNAKILRSTATWKKILTVHQYDEIRAHEGLDGVLKRLMGEWFKLYQGFVAADKEPTCV